MTRKRKPPSLSQGTLCLVRQKVFGHKHSIGDFWEITKYVVVEWQPNVPVYTIKPWQGEGWTWVVQRNLLMHIAHPHKQDKMGAWFRWFRIWHTTRGPGATWNNTEQYRASDTEPDQGSLASPKLTASMDWSSPICLSKITTPNGVSK